MNLCFAISGDENHSRDMMTRREMGHKNAAVGARRILKSEQGGKFSTQENKALKPRFNWRQA
jgi:hypothetical protein